MKVQLMIKSEVDESKHDNVELYERGHDSEVNLVLRLRFKSKVMRYYPGDGLSFDISLVIITLDRDENFPQEFTNDTSMHEFNGESFAQCRLVPGHVVQRGERAEEVAKGETVIEIPQGVDECWISLLDDVVKFECWMIVEVSSHRAEVLHCFCSSNSPVEDFVIPEFPDYRLVQQKLDVFDMVQGFDSTLSFLRALSVPGFPGVDTLQNT